MTSVTTIRTCVLTSILFAALLTGCGGSADPDPAKLAERIGAASCEKTSLTIESKLDGETRTVYDCYFRDTFEYRCVTESDNIAKDETDAVVALLEDTFATTKPACAR